MVTYRITQCSLLACASFRTRSVFGTSQLIPVKPGLTELRWACSGLHHSGNRSGSIVSTVLFHLEFLAFLTPLLSPPVLSFLLRVRFFFHRSNASCWKEKQNRNGGRRKEQRIKFPKKCFELLHLNVNDSVVVETCLNQDKVESESTWYTRSWSRGTFMPYCNYRNCKKVFTSSQN